MLRALIAIIIVLAVAWLVVSTWGADYYRNHGPCGLAKVHIGEASLLAIEDQIYQMSKAWEKNTRYDYDQIARDQQQVLHEAQAMQVPLCMRGVKEHVITGVQSWHASWFVPTNNPLDSRIEDAYSSAVINLYDAEVELAEVERCAPYCESIILGQLFP